MSTRGCLAILAAVLIVPGVLLNGWVLTLLWGWFLVPEPIGFPPIGLVHAVGISLLVGVVTTRYSHIDEEEIDAWLAASIAFTFHQARIPARLRVGGQGFFAVTAVAPIEVAFRGRPVYRCRTWSQAQTPTPSPARVRPRAVTSAAPPTTAGATA